MTPEQIQLIIWIWIGLILWMLFSKLLVHTSIQTERKNATKQSRSVILWEVNEKIAPLLPWFPYDFKDLVFIGKGIDYLVFDGLSEWKLNKIIFLELKSWVSQLNGNEKQIKECIAKNRIQYEVFRVSL